MTVTASNPRGRNLALSSPNATQPARLPGLIKPITGMPALDAWVSGMHEWRAVREGSRNNPFEKTLTARDLVNLGVITAGQVTNPQNVQPPPSNTPGGGVLVTNPNGGQSFMPLDQFFDSIRSTKLFADLTAAIDDPNRFNDLPAQVRDELLPSIAAEAEKRGAEIRRLDQKFQSATESFAQTIEEITAAVSGAAAGVREVRFAYASSNRATAGIVTQVQARLDNFSGGAPGTATVESKMTAIADRATGLEAQYVLKVATSGGAIAGFGLAATTSIAGVSTSAMLFLANKFAFVTNTDVIGTGAGQINPLSPPANRIMFGIDSDGAYVGGNLNVAGKAIIEASYTLASRQAALHVNHGRGATYGVVAYGAVAGGAAVYAVPDTNTFGVYSLGLGGGTPVIYGEVSEFIAAGGTGPAIYGVSNSATNPSVAAYNAPGAPAFDLRSGTFRITSSNFATGTATASVPLNNKPGSNVATANEWVEFYKGGTRGWIPWVPHS